MIVANIKQVSNMIEITELVSNHQYSDNLEMKIDLSDDTFKGLTIGFLASIKKKVYELSYNDENKTVKIPGDVFVENGYISISMFGIDETKTITSNIVELYIDESNSLNSINKPTYSEWHELAIQTIDQYMKKNIEPRFLAFDKKSTELQSEVEKQQETIDLQQEEVNRLQDEVDKSIKSINEKMSDGTFVPKHKWDGSVLYFSNPDSDWDEGFNVTVPKPIELTKVNLDTYAYVVNTTYTSDTLCTNGPLATVASYYIECLQIENGFVVRFTDAEGHIFTRKKINGTWDSNYSSPIY